MSEFTQGVCHDGTAILRNGVPLTPEQIIMALNKAQAIARSGHEKLNAFTEINAMCWNLKGRGETVIPINDILGIAEKYCDL